MTNDAEDETLSPIEQVACAIHAQLPGVSWTFGKAGDAEHGERRRYVWISQRSPAIPADQVGPRPEGDDWTPPAAGKSTNLIVSAWTLQDTVGVKIYAESPGAMWCMFVNLVAVAGQLLGPNFVLVSYTRGEEQPDGQTQRNQVALAVFSVRIPIPQEVQQLLPVGGYQDVCGWLEDDGTVTPQS